LLRTENTLIKYVKSDELYRILSNNANRPTIHVIDMQRKRWPQPIERKQLLLDISKEKVELIEVDDYVTYVDEDRLSEAAKKKGDFAWDLISYTFNQLEDESLIFNSKYRNRAMEETMEVYKVGYSTLKNYLIKYWQGGMIKSALIPRYHRCGAPGMERESRGRKRGRPRRISSGEGINIDGDIKRYFMLGLNKH